MQPCRLWDEMPEGPAAPGLASAPLEEFSPDMGWFLGICDFGADATVKAAQTLPPSLVLATATAAARAPLGLPEPRPGSPRLLAQGARGKQKGWRMGAGRASDTCGEKVQTPGTANAPRLG